jgi:hypothetical protein
VGFLSPMAGAGGASWAEASMCVSVSVSMLVQQGGNWEDTCTGGIASFLHTP